MEALPNEILIQIFKPLTYHDLRFRLPCVNRRFNHLLESPPKYGEFARSLFRDIPDPNLLENDDFEPHPAFRMLLCHLSIGSVYDVRLNTCSHCIDWANRKHDGASGCFRCSMQTKPDVKLVNHAIGNENAVSPAVAEAVIHVAGFPGIRVKAPNREHGAAIRVIDVVAVIANFLVGKMTKEDISTIWPDVPSSETLQYLGKIRADVMKYHYVQLGDWKGLDKTEVQDGLLHIYVFG